MSGPAIGFAFWAVLAIGAVIVLVPVAYAVGTIVTLPFQRSDMDEPPRNETFVRLLTGSVIVVPLAALGAVLLGRWLDPSVPFDRVMWLDQFLRDTARLRVDMTDDLREHWLEPGMTREEVSALLGPPEEEELADMAPEPIRPDADYWYLGTYEERRLVVVFDGDDRLLRTYEVATQD